MATTLSLDVVDLPDDHTSLSVGRLPRSANLLGSRCLDEVGVGDELALRRRRAEQSVIVVARLDRDLVPNDEGLLWLRSSRADSYLLHPATIAERLDRS